MEPRDRQRSERRWRRVLTAARRRLLLHGIVAWSAVAGAVTLVLLITLGVSEPPRWVGLGAVVSGGLLAGAALWGLIAPNWRRLRTRSQLARTLDRAGGYHDTLAAAEEALRRPERWRDDTPVRRALLSRLLARGDRLLGDLDLPRLLPVPRPWLTFVTLAAVLGAGFWLSERGADTAARGWDGVRTAWSPPRPPAGGLRLAPDPGYVVAGETRAVTAFDLVASEPEPPVCEVRSGSGVWRAVPARRVPVTGADPVLADPYEQWEARLRDVRSHLVYRFRRGDRVSEERRLEVWRPPLLTRLAAVVTPPAYTGLPAQDLDRLPAYLEVPAGSRVALDGRASSALAAALMVGEDDTTALAVDGDRVAGAFVVDAPRRFELRLRDARGLAGHGELTYEIAVVPDREPLARLQRPDDDGRLPLAAPLLLRAAAEDDYGLVSVDLLVRRGDPDGGAWVADLPGGGRPTSDDEGWERLRLLASDGSPSRGRRTVELSMGALAVTVTPREVAEDGAVSLGLSLAADALSLVPGDVLELALEAKDNRQPPPPGVGRSSVLRLQVPSSLELLTAREEAAGEHQAGLEAMRRQASDLGAQLERLRRELLKNPLPDWDRRQELQAALERQNALHDEMRRLAESLGRDLEELADNRLTSPELLEKMDSIADLLAEHENETMEALLESLRESLELLSPKELNRAMEDLAREQNELLRRLDTAMNMLDDLAREQEMEGLTDLVAEMLSKQQDLVEESQRQAEASRPQDGDEAGDDQADDEGDDQPGDESDGEAADEDQADGEPSEENREGEQGDPSDQGDPSGDRPQTEQGEQQGDRAGEQPDPQEMARRQEALAEEMKALEERLEELREELAREADEGDPTAAEETMRQALEEMLEQLEQQRTGDTMQQAGENLQQQQSDQASQQMDQALTDLAGLYHVMLKTQAAMQMAMKQEQAGQMRDVAADLLALSERQEDVGLNLPVSLREVRADNLARRQHEVVQGTITVRDALEEVADAAPQEILRMLKQLDELIEGQGEVLTQMQEGRAQSARRAATSSLASMNQLVINLLTQAQMTGQGGGSGQQQPMLSQQLRQMAEQQSGLNTLAEQLARKQGRLSQELRAGMQRLQQGQRGLAGQARELAEEQRQRAQRGEEGRLLGDLDALAEAMEEVGDDAAGGLITEQTLRRQDRILSRLLDMHNASRERDWARRRESRSSEELFADQAGEESPAIDEDAPEARRWRPVEEAPPAYRDLVRRYFRQIQRLHEETGRLDDGRPVDRSHGGS